MTRKDLQDSPDAATSTTTSALAVLLPEHVEELEGERAGSVVNQVNGWLASAHDHLLDLRQGAPAALSSAERALECLSHAVDLLQRYHGRLGRLVDAIEAEGLVSRGWVQVEPGVWLESEGTAAARRDHRDS